jgi:hypothetical protein
MIFTTGKPVNTILFIKLAWKMFHANNTCGYYHRYVKRRSLKLAKESYLLNDGSIPERTFRKISWYMVEAIILGELVARLAGESINSGNKESLMYLGAVMALYDVMIDDFNIESSIVNDILEETFSTDGNTYSAKGPAIIKVYFIYLRKLKSVIDPEFWWNISLNMNKIKHQLKSAEQKRDDANEKEIIEITLGKGGVSTLIISAFLGKKDNRLKDAIFEIGGFIQMMNDSQDIYRDTVSGIKTFVHFRKNFQDIIDRMNEQRIEIFKLIRSLDLPFKAIYETMFDLNAMFIVIGYKLHRYAEACNYSLDYSSISKMDKKEFRINPFSIRSVFSCTGKIIGFDPDNYETIPEFKFTAV